MGLLKWNKENGQNNTLTFFASIFAIALKKALNGKIQSIQIKQEDEKVF